MNIFQLEQKIDRIIPYQGKNYRYFSGTSYLGIGLVEEFQQKVMAGMVRYGLNHGQSRGNNVRLAVYSDFEAFFAQSAEAESALVLSSGYLAGTAAWQTLRINADQIWIAPDTHPAILPHELSPNPRQSFKNWKNECLKKSEQIPSQKILILGNAVDPLHSQIHEYDWLTEIGKKHELSLLIDDSHAFGVFGNGIFGTYSRLKSLPAKVVVSGSLGKGLALPAGIILCDQQTKSAILHSPIFGGSSPCPPGFLQAFMESQGIYSVQKQKLSTNTVFFHSLISKLDPISGNSGFPVFQYHHNSWVEQLEEAGFITSSFPYPTARDPRINRIVISAFHLKEDLEHLAQKLIELSSKNT